MPLTVQVGQILGSLTSLDKGGYSPSLQRRPSTLRLHRPPEAEKGEASDDYIQEVMGPPAVDPSTQQQHQPHETIL